MACRRWRELERDAAANQWQGRTGFNPAYTPARSRASGGRRLARPRGGPTASIDIKPRPLRNVPPVVATAGPSGLAVAENMAACTEERTKSRAGGPSCQDVLPIRLLPNARSVAANGFADVKAAYEALVGQQ